MSAIKNSKATGSPPDPPEGVAADLGREIPALCAEIGALVHRLASRAPVATGTLARARDAITSALGEIEANASLIGHELERQTQAAIARAKAVDAKRKADREQAAIAHVQRTMAAAKRARDGLAAIAAAEKIEAIEKANA